MARNPGKGGSSDPAARERILGATAELLRERRGADVTTGDVAARADCAKGLVHYHFRTKDQLMAAAAVHLWTGRTATWVAALAGSDPKRSIGDAWRLLSSEAKAGTAAACSALGMNEKELVVQSVNRSRESFGEAATTALTDLLHRMGRSPTVPPSELGALLVAVIEGIGLQLTGGVPSDQLEQAWAAFWVGLLSLTRSG